MSHILDIIQSKTLTYEQKVSALAHAAEDSVEVLNISEKTKYYMEKGAINDLFEGHAPYRPRYIMPDYEKYLREGSEFLELQPASNFDEALSHLQIIYHHVPSITTFPVYLGNLDRLLEPYITHMTDEEVKYKLKLFLNFLDRTITDSFCHANLGPEDSRIGRLILELEKELENAVPNFTMKYDPEITPDDYAEQALYTTLFCANPAFCNDKIHKNTYKNGYGISSCYNILPIGGGAYTLTRITLTKLASIAKNREDFMEVLLPDCLQEMGQYMNERIRFLVEKSNFFETSFLVKEGLIHPDNFLGMFGITGLAECVNELWKEEGKRYGHDKEADDFAEQIMEKIFDFANTFEAAYSKIADGHFMLHAQVGLESDLGITSGVRIPVGDEPEDFYEHLRHSARLHKTITTGCGDIFSMETTARKNPAAMLDVVKGSFQIGVKYMSFYEKNSDLVRITGYLVKRSEMEKFNNGEVVIQNTTHLGGPNYENNRLADRKVRNV